MKILFVNKVSPRLGGGAELRIREIVKSLVRGGYSVDLICGKTEKNMPNYEELDGMRIYYVKTVPEFLFRYKNLSFFLSRYFFYLTSFLKIYELAKKSDLIIDDVSPSPSFAFLISRIRRKRCYATIHELRDCKYYFKNFGVFNGLAGLFSLFLIKIIKYEKIIAVSTHTKELLEKYGIPGERIKLVTNGIDLVEIKKTGPERKEKNSLVTVGRLISQKNQIFLIKVMERILKKNPSVKFYIIGEGPGRKSLDNYIKERGLDKNVFLLGHVSQKTKIKRIKKSEIFVFSSLQEGFGITLLEGMACGLPVICYELPPYRDFIKDGENGILVKNMDPGLFSKKITELLENKLEIKRIGKNNSEHAKKFEWKKIGKLWMEEVLV